MLEVEVKKANLSGEIHAIPSKSYAHRIAICNFLSGKNPDCDLSGFTSKDITATNKCLEQIKNGNATLDCGESGSTLRFLMPLCAALGGKFTFLGHGKLMERPNDELFNLFIKKGLAVKKDDKIIIEGKLSSGEYKIRGDISSQYISGLLMALPILDGNSKITLTSPLVSAPYVDITLEVLKSYGINIEKTIDGFIVFGNQKYSGNIVCEGDWSNMAFFLVAGAMCGNITVKGLNLNSVQGDKYILNVLNLAGAKTDICDSDITVKKSELKAFTYSAENCPDLVPITAVLASVCEGKSVIRDVERLRIKESDRIESTINLLSSFGIKSTCDGKNLTVYGGKPTGGKVNSYNDHRLVMSATVLASVCDGSSRIIGAEAVQKSYPTFFDDYNKLGGNSRAV